MSAVSEIAVGGGRSLRATPRTYSGLERVERAERPIARLVTFSALALYGLLRWGTLISAGPGVRLVGLFALAVLVAGVGPLIDRRSRPLAVLGAICAVLGMLMISGIPATWLLHARISVISQGIGEGLSALPGILLPYIGINQWVRLVIALGAGALLLDAALLIAFAPRTLGDARRMAAALPLIALAIVPATLTRPQLPYLQGLILFVLLAAFMWSERMAPRHLAGAIALAGVAGAAGMIIAPGLDQRHPWLNYHAITDNLAPKNLDTFDWRQTYGPLNWPQHGRPVLEVKATRADYWKTQNLDVFNGVSWAEGPGVVGSRVPGPASWAVRRYTQTLEVTLRNMRTTDVVAAGSASEPQHVGPGVATGVSAGTWTAAAPLGPGDSYTVSTYSPRPGAAQLAAVKASDHRLYASSDFADELTMQLPSNGLTLGKPPEIQFPAFHSGGSPQNVIGPYSASGAQLIENSAYAPAYRLAMRLADGAATPYAFARSVEQYLSQTNGFTYYQNPPLRQYPLESFLFADKRGYCQQFAGAMALLLRMGGVPARVATGFTTGQYDSTNHDYVVKDTDAHAWVEVWFPAYGWVRFDPTPPSAPAISGGTSLLSTSGLTKGVGSTSPSGIGGRESRSVVAHATGHGGTPVVWIVIGVALAGGLAALGLGARSRREVAPGPEELVAELERALARSGRPLAGGTTLAAIERRFHSTPAAERYVRSLRLARFAGAAQLPSGTERRAVRAELAHGLGLAGRLRAWWALPPRFLN